MDRKSTFTKALRLLDASRDEEAVALLNNILDYELNQARELLESIG